MEKRALLAVANRIGADILPDNDQWTFRMEIRSETSGRLYVVAQNKKTKQWGCSCPRWKTKRTCKHLKSMLPLLEGPDSQTIKSGRLK